jgi:hypothetical protein
MVLLLLQRDAAKHAITRREISVIGQGSPSRDDRQSRRLRAGVQQLVAS